MNRAESAIEHAAFIAAVEQADDGIVVTDTAGRIRSVNPAFTAMTGYSKEEALGRKVGLFQSSRRSLAFHPELWSTIQCGNVWEGRVTNQRKDGTSFDQQMRIAPVLGPDGKIGGYIAIHRDVTEPRAHGEAQALLAAIVEGSEDAIVTTDAGGTILTWNLGAETLLGYTAQQAIGRHVSIFTPPNRLHRMSLCIDHVSRGQVLRNYQGVCRRADGGDIHVTATGFPIKDSTGKVVAATAVLRDDTKRTESELRLRESEERFRSIFENAPFGMCVSAMDGRFIQVNEALSRMLGYSREQLLRMSWPALIHPDDLQSSLNKMKLALEKSEGYVDDEMRNLHRNGDVVWVRVRVSLVRTESGGPVHCVVHLEDVTERKRREEASRLAKIAAEAEDKRLDFQHSLISAILEVSLDGILVVNDAGNVVSHNKRFLDLWKIDPSKYATETEAGTIAVPDDSILLAGLEMVKEPEAFLARVRKLYADPTANDHCEFELKDGRTLERYSASLRGDNPERGGRVWFFRDITERKRSEQALIESEHRFRIMADSCPIGIWVTDTEGGTRFINRTYRDFCGYPAEMPEPDAYLSLLHPHDAPEFVAAFTRALREHLPFKAEQRSRRADGAWRWVESMATPRFSPEGEFCGLVGTSKDVTERKLVEARLQEARDQSAMLQERVLRLELEKTSDLHRLILSAAGEGIYGLDADGLTTFVNPAAAAMLGYAPEELVGKPQHATIHHTYPDGTAYQRENCLIYKALYDGQVHHCDSEVFWKKDGASFPVAYTSTPLLRDGRPDGAVVVFQEISERKRRERADAANLAKSRFLANMSHEIRTPMNGVIGMNQLLLETTLTAEQRRYVEVAQSSGRALLALIDDILDLSKIEAGKIALENRSFTLDHAVEDAVHLLHVQASAKELRIDSRVSSKIPGLLRGDAHRLRQVLTNLISNAIKFTAHGGITVDAELQSLSDLTAVVRFTIADTGIGMRADQIAGLFSPFVQADASTTRKYGGTGLGLAISKQLVEMMGGSIGVNSHEGNGSTFWFTAKFDRVVPVERHSASPSAHGPGEDSVPAQDGSVESGDRKTGNGERILVVEDNSTNREVILAQLKKLGYNGEAVINGAEAVDAVQHREFDVVLMDCAMPVMDGYEATHHIRHSARAHIPIIALTASAMSSDRDRCRDEGMDDFLAKPVDLSRLAAALAKWVPLPRSAEAARVLPDFCEEPAKPRFDADALLRRLMGDRELAQIILKGFLSEAPSQLENLRARIDESDASSTRLHAHSLKGAAATVGAEFLHPIAMEMESAAMAGRMDLCRDLLARAHSEFVRFRETVERDRLGDESK